jgi:hypothetical protein
LFKQGSCVREILPSLRLDRYSQLLGVKGSSLKRMLSSRLVALFILFIATSAQSQSNACPLIVVSLRGQLPGNTAERKTINSVLGIYEHQTTSRVFKSIFSRSPLYFYWDPVKSEAQAAGWRIGVRPGGTRFSWYSKPGDSFNSQTMDELEHHRVAVGLW